MLLCGEPPFYHSDNFELFEIIKKGDFNMKGPIWESVSDGAKDLVCRLLTVDPAQRITGKEILDHPWIQGKSTMQNTNVLAIM